MFQDMLAMSNNGGESKYAQSKIKNIATNGVPSWSNTPFKAKRVIIDASMYYNGNIRQRYANYNPATGEITTSSVWLTSQNSPDTWSESTLFSFIITDNSVTLNRQISGVTSCYVVFHITDGEFELEE